MDVSKMTLEGFFLTDYERLRRENEELRAKLDSALQYGVFDLGRETECVRVSVASYSGYETSIDGITSQALRDALEMDDDALWDWAVTRRKNNRTSWYSPFSAISIERLRFAYTFEVRESRSTVTFVSDLDPRRDEVEAYPLKSFEGDDCLGVWQDAGRLDYIKTQALDRVRCNIKKAIPSIEEEA